MPVRADPVLGSYVRVVYPQPVSGCLSSAPRSGRFVKDHIERVPVLSRVVYSDDLRDSHTFTLPRLPSGTVG